MSTATSGSVLIGVTIMTEVLAAGAIGLRMWSRQLKKRKLSAHDVFIISALICSTALEVGLVCSVVNGGLGRRAADFNDQPWKVERLGKHCVLHGQLARLSLHSSYADSSWGQLAVGGTCKNAYAANISIHSTNFILDSSVGLIPIMVLKDLKMPTRRKVGIGSMFALGTLLMLTC
ncbi:hypothetical protein PG996_013865 [Apiospora saccharicola]|uniref:Rhodopsin domain-containing protein n=1 Tax=Apiospora saccharicola TaxID=335842 RepID=A0ABR1TIL2_9PEZI